MLDLTHEETLTQFDLRMSFFDLKSELYKEASELHKQWEEAANNKDMKECERINDQCNIIIHKIDGINMAQNKLNKMFIKKS